MDPVEILELCAKAARAGAPRDITVPRIFNSGDYHALWMREPKRVRKVFDEIMCGAFPGDGLELLMRSGALDSVLPEFTAIKDLGDADGLHKDVWEHTKRVVSGVPAIIELRWGAMFHDVGKAKTRRITKKGKVTFHGHDAVGARMVDAVQKRTNLFGDDVALLRTVRHLVEHHLRPAAYHASWSDSAVRRLVNDCGDPKFFEKLMLLSRADLTTKVPAKRTRCLARAAELEKRVADVIAKDNAPKLPKLVMGAIIEKTGLKPGKWCTYVKESLEKMMRDGELSVDSSFDTYVNAGVELTQLSLEQEKLA